MTIRTLILDDVSLAGPKTRAFLQEHSDFEIVGETGGHDLPSAVVSLKPSLILANADILGTDGIRSIAHLELPRAPNVVFISAHGEHAVEAFDVGALDYLVKPLTKERFNRALDRVRNRQNSGSGEGNGRLLDWLRVSVADRSSDRIVLKTGGRILLLDTSRIEWVEAYGDYVKVHSGKQSHLTRERMQRIESQLDPHKFVRVHRSAIVNLAFMSELRPALGGDYYLILRDGTQLRLSRSYRRRIQTGIRCMPQAAGTEGADSDTPGNSRRRRTRAAPPDIGLGSRASRDSLPRASSPHAKTGPLVSPAPGYDKECSMVNACESLEFRRPNSVLQNSFHRKHTGWRWLEGR